MNNYNVLVILAGGTGSRYKTAVPKQYTKINGKELLEYSILEMRNSQKTNRLLVVVNNNERAINHVKRTYDVETVVGGNSRAMSFQNALEYIKMYYPECKKVVFHEAARPLVTHTVIDRYFDLLEEYDFVESCRHITDSLGSYVMTAPRREDYYLIQAPEAYRFPVLLQYYKCDSDIYFAANQFPSFIKGYQNFDIENNIKLTTPQDRAIIEYILQNKSK